MHERPMESSSELMDLAKRHTPGGVHSYARKFERPLSFDRGKGSKVFDLDNNEYVDYLNAWGAIILGHCHETVNESVSRTLESQDLYGMGTTELETEVAGLIKDRIPSAEKVLFGVTGSEVVARAITLARAVTGRKKIIKFQGHYHGWYDSVAMNHLSDPENIGSLDPFTEGLLPEVVDQTVVLPFNDVEAVRAAMDEHRGEIAAILLEPIGHNMGCVTPQDGYLDALREITDEHDSLLIFDEIITGFRHGNGGVQQLEGVVPDLTTLGKSIANGYPMSVLCGKAAYMNHFHTNDGGDVAYGGTYNAHASALAAAFETIRLLERENYYRKATAQSNEIAAALNDLINDICLDAQVKTYGTTFLTYFTKEPIHDYEDVLKSDVDAYRHYRWNMVDQGVLMVPKNVRRNYLTASHTEADIEKTIEAAENAYKSVKAVE
jgi:glutamate-1-semialdehyde 2,1-aminomutase